MLLGLGSGLPSYNLPVPHLALLELQRRYDEALEQGMCAVGTALELGVEPVSYTHLDLPEVPGAAGDLGDAESADGLAPQEHGKQDAEADALAQSGGRASVSYTHLDVYKRQGPPCRCIRCSRPCRSSAPDGR